MNKARGDNMKKLYSIFLIVLLLSMSSFAYASEGHEAEIEEGRQLVESQVSCDELTDEQLEAIGEYVMESMHPGEAHDLMHERMGVEGDYVGGMMGFGMMGNNLVNPIGGGTMAYGMMGTGMSSVGWSLYGLFWIALVAFVVSVIFWSTYNWLVKGKKKR
jgi:hypothetical protein